MRQHFIAPLSIFIASVVVLGSLHASQLVGAFSHAADDAKKITHEDTAVKVARDLHHHSDKSGAQLIKDVGDHQQYVDNRSLRLRDNKKDSLRNRLAERWHRALLMLSLTYHRH